MVAVVAAKAGIKAGSKGVAAARANPGAGILIAVVGVLVLVNAFRSTKDAITGAVEGVVEDLADLPGEILEAVGDLPSRLVQVLPTEPFPYESFGDVGNDLFDFFGYDLRDAPGDVLALLPWVDGDENDESDYIDYGSSTGPLLLFLDQESVDREPIRGFV